MNDKDQTLQDEVKRNGVNETDASPDEVEALGEVVAAVSKERENSATNSQPTALSLADKMKDPDGKLPAPETGNWGEEWPKTIVKQLKSESYDPKRPEGGGIDLDSIRTGTENGGQLKSRLATELAPPANREGALADYLSDGMSVLIGGPRSRANSLALEITKAVALGGTVLGVAAKPGLVLYVDSVRPEDKIVEALGADQVRLGNLLVMAKGTTDADVRNEVNNLRAVGIELGLVVINEFGRIMSQQIYDKIVRDIKAPYLVVLPETTFNPKKNYRWDKSKAIRISETEHVIYLEPITEDATRLTIVKYGEVVKDLAVDPNAGWMPLGKPKEGVNGKRQAAVLAAVTEAGEDGLEPKEVAMLLDMDPNSAYQALFLLGRGSSPKVFKKNKRYYVTGATPKPSETKTA